MRASIQKRGNYLVASIQSPLTDKELLKLRDDLAWQVGKYRAQGVIVDVTVLDVIDSFATHTLSGLAQMVRRQGGETVIAGIQPDVAFAMVQLGLDLKRLETALDLEAGLEVLRVRTQGGSQSGGG